MEDNFHSRERLHPELPACTPSTGGGPEECKKVVPQEGGQKFHRQSCQGIWVLVRGRRRDTAGWLPWRWQPTRHRGLAVATQREVLLPKNVMPKPPTIIKNVSF